MLFTIVIVRNTIYSFILHTHEKNSMTLLFDDDVVWIDQSYGCVSK